MVEGLIVENFTETFITSIAFIKKNSSMVNSIFICVICLSYIVFYFCKNNN